METYFASTVLRGDSELKVDSRLFAGSMEGMGHFLATLLGALSQHDAALLMLHRAANIEDFEEQDFDAPINISAMKKDNLTPGRLIAGDPYSGQLEAALPESGAFICLVEDAGDDGAHHLGMVAVRAADAAEALKHVLSDAQANGRTLHSLEGLMDAALHPDDAYEFDTKPSALAAEIAGGAPIARSESVPVG
ncbi:MAG: hypothetical protein AAF667_00960 [Pseudomonadota bacterium]